MYMLLVKRAQPRHMRATALQESNAANT